MKLTQNTSFLVTFFFKQQGILQQNAIVRNFMQKIKTLVSRDYDNILALQA